MEASNNNIGGVDLTSDPDNSAIDRLEMFVRYRNNINASTNVLDNIDEDENDKSFNDFNYNENQSARAADKNMSFSDSLTDAQKRAVAVERRTSSLRRMKMIFENSYRMEPKPDQYFVSFKVKNVIKHVVGPMFSDFIYESGDAAKLCQLVSSKVLFMIKKKYEWPRYRYVCHVTLAQLRKNQGIIIADRCLWFPPVDSCAACTFVNKTAVLVVTLHAIFFE